MRGSIQHFVPVVYYTLMRRHKLVGDWTFGPEQYTNDMDSLGRTLQVDLPRDWASLALHRDVWRGVVSRC